MTLPQVRVLCEGFIRRNGKAILEAHGSSTLVLCGPHKLVVDTSSPAYRDRVLAAMIREGIDPEQVDLLVNTHDHHDHVGNNQLFRRAKPLALGRGEKEMSICPGVRLIATPGHTSSSVSVFVESEVRYAIVGDAIPTRDNYEKWLPPGINYDPDLALGSMRSIVDFADVIVPGHGPPFRVDR